MQCTYYFLKQFSDELAANIVGMAVSDCFSQNKNELVISFANAQKELHLILNLSRDFNCFATKTVYHKAKSKYQNHFKLLLHSEVKAIRQISYDRSFQIKFDKGQSLFFKLHGNRSNVILLDKKGEAVELFIPKLREDFGLVIKAFEKSQPQWSLDQIQHQTQPSQLNPLIGKTANQYLLEEGWETLCAQEKSHLLAHYCTQIESNPKFLILEGTKPDLLINELSGYRSAMEASNELFYALNHYHFFDLPKKQASIALQKRIHQTEKYIGKCQEQLAKFGTQTSLREKADVLMANLHLVTEIGLEYVLDNFYGGAAVVVTLKANEKPQDIAAKWYRKEKNKHLEVSQIEHKITLKKEELTHLTLRLEELSTLESARELNGFLSTEQVIKKTNETSLFKETSFLGFPIYIGRNSKNNDELLKFGKKEDLWLHAKDVPGSHVLIKKVGTQNIPKSVIEHAACLAAHYSKRKMDTLCPVIYTPLKYVRKRKGLLPGQVIVEKENVVLVEPKAL